jgi:CENP-S associating Centromere protein X
MPSTSAAAANKRKRPAFSPPRPKVSQVTSGNGVSKGSSAGKSTGRAPTSKARTSSRLTSSTPSESDSTAEESELGSVSRSPSPHSEPDYILAEVTRTEVAVENEPTIPLALIHTLLNHHFSDKDRTRISQDAKAVIGKYVDTFVREAIARSAFERQDKATADAKEEMNGRGDDGWLEVEDLEKMAPQLVLDF